MVYTKEERAAYQKKYYRDNPEKRITGVRARKYRRNYKNKSKCHLDLKSPCSIRDEVGINKNDCQRIRQCEHYSKIC